MYNITNYVTGKDCYVAHTHIYNILPTYTYILPSYTSTVEAVMTLAWCVAGRWKEFADGFGIDEDLVDEIFTNNQTDEACLQDCVEKWMKLGPTWKKLANVLRGMGEERLAGQAASKGVL